MEQGACVTDKCDSILDKIVQTILPFELVDFLNIRLLKTKYIDLNLWGLVHFATGAIFFFIWKKYSNNLFKGFWVWLLIHGIWEAIEFSLALKGLYPALFFEEYVDIAWDVLISQLGYKTMLWRDKLR